MCSISDKGPWRLPRVYSCFLLFSDVVVFLLFSDVVVFLLFSDVVVFLLFSDIVVFLLFSDVVFFFSCSVMSSIDKGSFIDMLKGGTKTHKQATQVVVAK